MSSEVNSQNSTAPTDPMELWKRWNETTSKVWLDAIQSNAEATTNSYGLYRSWVQSVGESVSKGQEQMKVHPFQMMNSKDAWKTWFDTTMETWRKAVETGGDPLGLTKQWLKMMEEAQAKLLAGTPLQTDPFTLFKEWYDATSDQWSKVVEETLSSKQFLEFTRPFLESYASISLAFRRANEEYFKRLQLPTISDIANVATLVINLEEKVDKVEDSLESFEDTYANVATLEAVASLEQRLDKVATTEMLASLEQRLNQLATTEMVAGLEQRLNQLATTEMVAGLEQRLGQVATTEMVAGLEQRLGQVATTETTANLEQRLNQVESKLDKVLAALEKLGEKGAGEPALTSDGTPRKAQKKSTSQQET
ncbi:MAG: hypothetical protein NVS4B11_08060 [Ktedonobacteraceae bacterium]